MAESEVEPGRGVPELMEVTSPFSETVSPFDAAARSCWPRSDCVPVTLAIKFEIFTR